MKIVGIDPGTHRAGFGVVEKHEDGFTLLETGILESSGGSLLVLKKSIDAVFRKHKPEAMAIEKLFFTKNQKTGIQVAEARGVLLLCAEERGIPLFEYAPTEIKSSITGYGGADKQAVIKMVKLILNSPDLDISDDAADAVAAAITACNDPAHLQRG